MSVYTHWCGDLPSGARFALVRSCAPTIRRCMTTLSTDRVRYYPLGMDERDLGRTPAPLIVLVFVLVIPVAPTRGQGPECHHQHQADDPQLATHSRLLCMNETDHDV